MHGYHGYYLRIDLGRSVRTRVPIPEDVYASYLGGVGLGTWLLCRESIAGRDARDPSAPLVLAFSPLVGTPLTTSAKFAVVAKSPLTDRVCDGMCGSAFAIDAKRLGCDAIVLVGRAPQWSTVLLDDDSMTLHPARKLLGLSALDAQLALQEEWGSLSILAIGPAGEAGVLYATISHDSRHVGRGGLGTVLGSKRVKAIAARGSRPTPLADADRVRRIADDLWRRSVGPATEKYRKLGTVANLLTFNRLNVLPTRNFQQATFEGALGISGEELMRARGSVRKSCASCTIGCEHIFPTAAGRGVRLEYESLFALGSLCGIGDPESILAAAALCDEVGIDTISFGGTFAFACECVERGRMAAPPDLDLRFGSPDGLLEAIRQVSNRSGAGRWLAEGSRKLARRLGGDAIDFAPQVKGLELPGYEPRTLQTMALGLAVGARGADHNRSGAYEVDFSDQADRRRGDPRTVRLAVETEDKAALFDSLILCKFLRNVFTDPFAESAAMLAAVTGREWTAGELSATAQRIVLLRRFYNCREGWTRIEDSLPPRFFCESIPGAGAGAARLDRATFDAMVDEYYRLRGLGPAGDFPKATAQTLENTLAIGDPIPYVDR